MLKKVARKVIEFSHFLSNECLLSTQNIETLQVKKKVVFYTLGWGDYLDIFFNYSLPSILHKSNIPKLKNDGFEMSFMLYTIDSEKDIKTKYKRQIETMSPYHFNIIPFDIENEKKSIIANTSIIKVFKYCLDNQLIMFMAPPDTVFSNYSVYNSISYSYLKRKSFAAAHPRINDNFLSDFIQFPEDGINSNEMVAYTFKNAHQNFKYADEELPLNTVYAGISYRRFSSSLYAITSNMPTTYVVIPTLEDINFFKTSGTFNDWDRGWLSFLLKKNRVKISGSSDMFFCVEITENKADAIVQPKKPSSPWSDLYSKSFANRISNTFISIWRE